MREGGFDAAFLAVGAHIGKRAYIPAGAAAKILDAVSLLRSMEGEDTPLLGRRVVDLRRRQYRDRRRPHRQAARRDRGDHRLSPHPRANAGARFRGRGGAAGRRHDEMALDHQTRGRAASLTDRKDEARRQGLPAADRRVRDAGGRLAGAGARPGRRSLAARRQRRARDRGRRGQGRRRT